MDWRHDYVDGNVRSSCSICGRSRRFPESLTFCDDKLFRCESCMEKTALAFDREIAAARQRREQPDVAIGIRPPWEATDSLLTIATERAAALLPGWTPATTINETFDTVPGGAGSAWTVVSSGGGTVSAPESGVARFDSVATGGVARAYTTSFSMTGPANTSGTRGYIIGQFRVSGTLESGCFIGLGVTNQSGSVLTGSSNVGVGAQSVEGVFFSAPFRSGAAVRTDVPVDSVWHYGEVWWSGNGYARGSVDFCPTGTVSGPTLSGTQRPAVGVAIATGSDVIDLTGLVAFT